MFLTLLLRIVSLCDTSPCLGGFLLLLAHVHFIPGLCDKLYIYRVAASGCRCFPAVIFIRIIHNSDGDISFLVCFNCFQKYTSEAPPPPNLERWKSYDKLGSKSQTRRRGLKCPSFPNTILFNAHSCIALLVLISNDVHCALFWAKMSKHALIP